MDYDRVRDWALVVTAAAALFGAAAVGFKIGQKHPLKLDILPVNEKADTLYIRDTITREKPVYLTRYVDRVQLVPVRDTIRLKDTLFVALERERVEWRDEYAAVYASGIDPAVDSVKHYITEKVVTKEVTIQVPGPQRWRRVGWGVAAGPGVFWNHADGVRPGVGAVMGVQFRF